MTARAALFALMLAVLPRPAAAQDPRCLWTSLPPVAQTRIELSVRLGDAIPISVITRFGQNGLAKLLIACGYADSFDDFQRASAIWLASASYEVARTRVRLAGFDPAAVDAAEDAAAPRAERKRLAEAVMRRERGVAEAALLAAVEGATAGGSYTPSQKRLLVEYLVARLILRGLEAGAEPPPAP